MKEVPQALHKLTHANVRKSSYECKADRKLSSYFGVVPLYLSVVPWYDKKYDNLRSQVVLFNAF